MGLAPQGMPWADHSEEWPLQKKSSATPSQLLLVAHHCADDGF